MQSKITKLKQFLAKLREKKIFFIFYAILAKNHTFLVYLKI